MSISPTDYYASQSDITDPRTYASLFECLPAKIDALVGIVQGIIIHPFEAHRYHIRVPKKRLNELDTRWIALMLARVYELDAQPLTVTRPPGKRFAGNCRDFATLLCAMLRHDGVPARVRYGFATYFEPHFYTDHVVCEYWNDIAERWIIVDAQIDVVQRQAYQVSINTCDVPGGTFVFANKAWQMFRAGEAEPARFGIFVGGPVGDSFIRSGLVRDLAALNKQELLCQDVWGLGEVEDERNLSGDDLTLLDKVAALTSSDDTFDEIQAIYQSDSRLRVPPIIKCYTQDGLKMIDIAAI